MQIRNARWPFPVGILAVCVALGLAVQSCQSPRDPTAEELATADYGPRPDEEAAQSACIPLVLLSNAVIEESSDNPEISFGPLERSWFRPDECKQEIIYAWLLPVEVTVTDEPSQHSRPVPWHFFFRGDRLIGVGQVGPFGIGKMSYRRLDSHEESPEAGPRGS